MGTWVLILFLPLDLFTFLYLWGLLISPAQDQKQEAWPFLEGLFSPFYVHNLRIHKPRPHQRLPLEMALLDILWGPILCGLSAMIGFKKKKPSN